jgi:hypothetical protein
MATQPILYVNYDFDTLLAQLQQRLAMQGSWKDMYKSATGEMLTELFAAVGTLLLYYVERRAEESYILTAQNRSSIINLVRLLNYIPTRNVSATGTLRFSLAAPATKIVFIPKYTICKSTAYSFLAASDDTINVGQTYVDISGIQGVKQVITYTASGIASPEYNIKDTKIENSNLEVVVTPSGSPSGVVWTQVRSFFNSTNISTHYVIRPELDDTITIVFGNNVFGMAPGLGDTITLTYIQSDGSAGNVYYTGIITDLQSPIYDQDGALQTVTVTNTTTFLGGADIESTEEIREDAPAVFATGDRAVTRADFVALVNAYPQVADCNVWGEAEEPSPDYTHYNQVKLVVILDNWIAPDGNFETTLSNYLYTKSMMTVRYSYISPIILDVIPTLVIKCLAGSSLSYVQSLIETAVSDQFILGSTTRLGISHRESDIITAIDEVPGVSYSHMTLKIRKELTSTHNISYNWSETMEALPLKRAGVEIYIDDTPIAIDNGAGIFTDLSVPYTITGVVNYTNGEVGVNISPAPPGTSTVFCRYQQDKSGDIEVSKQQICKWIENDYTSIEYA